MYTRIAAVFDTRGQAETARNELMLAGFESEAIVLISSCEASDWVSDAGESVVDGYALADDMQIFFGECFSILPKMPLR